MKKLVLAALAIGTMAACTKSNVQYEQPGEISFQPVTQKATKAAVAGPTYPTDDAAYNFNVWAWWGNDNAIIDGTYSKFSSLYIDKGTFVHKGNNTWGGDPAYYWPTTGSLVFAGYSPAANLGGTFGYSIHEKKFTITNYKQSADPANTKDLMWFDVTSQSYNTRVQTGSNVVPITAGNGVPVTFKHALSWLTFKSNVSSKNLNENWTITDITLNNINTIGNCVAEKSDEAAEVAIWDVTNVTESQVKSSMNVLADTPKVVTYKEQEEENPSIDNGGVVIIPQPCTSVTITFTQKNYVNTSTSSQTIDLPLNAGIDGDSWESGKHYIYTIVFSADEILIAPKVANWEDVTVTDIPVKY